MPQVEVINDCFLADGSYHKKGDPWFEYKGPPNENLRPVKPAKGGAAAPDQAGTVPEQD